MFPVSTARRTDLIGLPGGSRPGRRALATPAGRAFGVRLPGSGPWDGDRALRRGSVGGGVEGSQYRQRMGVGFGWLVAAAGGGG